MRAGNCPVSKKSKYTFQLSNPCISFFDASLALVFKIFTLQYLGAKLFLTGSLVVAVRQSGRPTRRRAPQREQKMKKANGRTKAQVSKAASKAAKAAWVTMKSKGYLKAALKGPKAIQAYLASR
jgi:hypothetical protein